MTKRPRDANELRKLIRKGCDFRINGWAVKAGVKGGELRRRVRSRVAEHEEQQTLQSFEAQARNDLATIQDLVPFYLPAVTMALADDVLTSVPSSPPSSPALQRMEKIIAAIREHASEALSEDPDDIEDVPDNESEEISSNFRKLIIQLFDHDIPGLHGRPDDGRLAVLSLWLSPSHGCGGARQDSKSWTDVYGRERRAIAIARKPRKRP